MNIAVPIEAGASKIKLSRKAVEAVLAAPRSGKRRRYWFEDQPGLYLSVSKGGAVSYCLRYPKLSGKTGDFTIGAANVITPQEARDKARDSLAELTLHHRDPVEARREAIREAQAAPSKIFRVLARDFLQAAEIKALSPRTIADWEWLLEKHLLPGLGDLDAATVTRREVKDCLRAKGRSNGKVRPTAKSAISGRKRKRPA